MEGGQDCAGSQLCYTIGVFAYYLNRCGCGGLSGIAQGFPLEEVGRRLHREVQQNIQ